MSLHSTSQWCSLCVCRRINKPRGTIKCLGCKDDVVVEYKDGVKVIICMKSSVQKLVVWRKNEYESTKKHLWELQMNFVEKHQEKGGVSRNDG